MHVFPYLDDWLIKASSLDVCTHNTQQTLTLLHQLGFIIHLQKLNLQPRTIQPYLGAMLNTRSALACRNPDRINNIVLLIQQFQAGPFIPAKTFLRLLDMIAFCILIVPHARLHMRPLQDCVSSQWTQSLGQLHYLVLGDRHTHHSLQWYSPQNL